MGSKGNLEGKAGHKRDGGSYICLPTAQHRYIQKVMGKVKVKSAK